MSQGKQKEQGAALGLLSKAVSWEVQSYFVQLPLNPLQTPQWWSRNGLEVWGSLIMV